MKYKIFTVIALLGSTAAELFGGWDTALKTLLIFMVLDWLTGGIILPAVFRKVCIGFIANEVLSIVENAGLMGVPMPSMIKKAVDILKDTAESGVR